MVGVEGEGSLVSVWGWRAGEMELMVVWGGGLDARCGGAFDD